MYFPKNGTVLSGFSLPKIVSSNNMLLSITQKDGYKLGSETLKLSNFSPRISFWVSSYTQNWVNHWFVEPNKVSVT